MSAVWDKAKAEALKILGKDADVPDLPAPIDKAGDALSKANDDFDKCRDDLEGKLVAVQNANDAVRNLLKQFEAKVDKSDFDLDPKKKDDAQKIQKAKKILVDALTTGIKHREADDKMLDELDKHVIQLGKYKPSKI